LYKLLKLAIVLQSIAAAAALRETRACIQGLGYTCRVWYSYACCYLKALLFFFQAKA